MTELGRKLRYDLWNFFSSDLSEIWTMSDVMTRSKVKVTWPWKLEIPRYSTVEYEESTVSRLGLIFSVCINSVAVCSVGVWQLFNKRLRYDDDMTMTKSNIDAWCLVCMVQVKDRLQQLAVQRGGMMEQWEEGWEYLQLSQSLSLFYSLSLGYRRT